MVSASSHNDANAQARCLDVMLSRSDASMRSVNAVPEAPFRCPVTRFAAPWCLQQTAGPGIDGLYAIGPEFA
jgi:hypothetical protein